MNSTTLVTVILIGLTANAWAFDNFTPISKSNPIRVRADFHGTVPLVESALLRRLRAFEDVIIAPANPDLTMEVLLLEARIKTPQGLSRLSSWAASVVVTAPLSLEGVDMLLTNSVDSTVYRNHRRYLEKGVLIKHHTAVIIPVGEVNECIEDLAATIDREVFEECRQYAQSLVDFLRKNKRESATADQTGSDSRRQSRDSAAYMQVVTIEGVGRIEFPADMTQAEMEAVLTKLHAGRSNDQIRARLNGGHDGFQRSGRGTNAWRFLRSAQE